MVGLIFDFENCDLKLVGGTLEPSFDNSFDDSFDSVSVYTPGYFDSGVIDSQNCALISLSQVCLLTRPETGMQLSARLANRKAVSVSQILAESRRQVELDGGTDVEITLISDNLQFKATYDY